MKKRQQDDDGSDMEVNEQKVEHIEPGEDDDEDEDIEMIDRVDDSSDDDGADEDQEEDAEPTSSKSNEFMDSFYGLSSVDPKERAQASQIMLHHCLLGPNANTKDAAYAFRRLLNGVCSGRACARQGNASALSSFLKVAVTWNDGQLMNEIRDHNKSDSDDEESSSMLRYVRQRLITATDPSGHISGSKKKGSEERDYQFGRLFGILSIARSGILLPISSSRNDIDNIQEVTTGLVHDLIELYKMKIWMREPASHAIVTILTAFYSECNDSKDAKEIVHYIVTQVVIPKIPNRRPN